MFGLLAFVVTMTVENRAECWCDLRENLSLLGFELRQGQLQSLTTIYSYLSDDVDQFLANKVLYEKVSHNK